jgi:hypothetical protein
MNITRERYLDDGSLHGITLVLQTRTREMHSLLSDVPDDVRAQLADELVVALDRIQKIVAPVLDAARRRGGETSSFGCGT